MSSGPPAARPGVSGRAAAGGDALFGALLFVAALAPRLVVGLAWASEPVWDGHYYDFGARRLAEGLGYSDDLTTAAGLVWHPWCHYPVGYSAFLALFYRVLGAGPAVAAVANALVGAALAVVTWALAAQGLSQARARVAGLVVAFHPGLVLYAALVMTEPLAALLTLTAFWVAGREAARGRGLEARAWWRAPGVRGAVAGGSCWGSRRSCGRRRCCARRFWRASWGGGARPPGGRAQEGGFVCKLTIGAPPEGRFVCKLTMGRRRRADSCAS